MHHRPLQQITCQNQEIKTSGCCLNNYLHQKKDNPSVSPSRVRIYSEPKDNKEKKIDLLIAKRGYSSSKDHPHANASITKSKVALDDRSAKMNMQNVKQSITFTTRATSEMNSLRNSDMGFNHYLKISRPCEQSKYQTLPTGNTAQYFPQNRVTPPPSTPDENINLISEISFVSEEFLSQGSPTINLLNILTEQDMKENQERTTQNSNNRETCNINAITTKPPPRYESPNPNPNPNPLDRMQDRKRFDKKPDLPKKKLVL